MSPAGGEGGRPRAERRAGLCLRGPRGLPAGPWLLPPPIVPTAPHSRFGLPPDPAPGQSELLLRLPEHVCAQVLGDFLGQ